MSRYRTRALLTALALVLSASLGRAQAPDPNAYPTPYHEVPGWAKLPDGRKFGQVIGVYPARDGKHIWVFERCGDRYCTTSPVAPIDEFDASGKLVRSFGAGLFVFAHGLSVDAKGNIWVTDSDMKDGKGNQVWKFSPSGKVLMTLGKKGVAGSGPGEFDKPTFAVVAKDGSIFVGDGHGKNDRIEKFSADGKFILAWGKHGTGPGEFSTPHAAAFDSQGRLFVADRENGRLQLFDQSGKFLAEWRQFGKPSGIYIDKHDTMYVADSESNPESNPGFRRGIRIGSAKTGKVAAFIPDPNPPHPGSGVGTGSFPEGIAADAAGNVYGGETTERALVKWSKK